MQSITTKLEIANTINKEIREIDLFISTAEQTWKGRVTQRFITWKLFSHPYGIYGEKSIEIDTDTKNKVLDVLRDKRKSLEHKLNQLFKEE